VGVVGQSSKTSQRAPWFPNWHGAWRYCVAVERLPPLSRLEIRPLSLVSVAM
jgi:hypothetical protein